MVELITLTLGLAALIMGWKYVTRTFDWIGSNIGRTSVILEDLTVSATLQTQRGVVISADSLEDTVLESQKKAAKRAKDMSAFLKNIDKDQKTQVEAHEKRLQRLLARKYD
jgi:hypothetical protein